MGTVVPGAQWILNIEALGVFGAFCWSLYCVFYLRFKLFPLFFPPSKPAKPVSSLSLLCIKANTALQTVTRPECPLLGKAVLWLFLACRCAVSWVGLPVDLLVNIVCSWSGRSGARSSWDGKIKMTLKSSASIFFFFSFIWESIGGGAEWKGEANSWLSREPNDMGLNSRPPRTHP